MDQIVNAYDVRGEQLDAATVTALAAAFADVVASAYQAVVVGHDMRTTSADLVDAAVAALTARGMDVLRLGLCSTDELYYACGVRALPGLMVTAGNHPASFNGLKLCGPRATPVDEDTGLYQVAAIA